MRSDRLKRTTLAAVVVVAMLTPRLAHADTPLVQSQGPNLGTWSIGQIEIPLSATGGDGGTYTWSVIGSLPPGMSLRTDKPSWFPSSASAGVIGVATKANTYTFILRVTSNGVNTDQTCTLKTTLLRGKDNQQLPDAFVGAFYTHTLTALGGTVTWTATEPAFPVPPGMTLSAAGVLSGTPTTAGNDRISVGFADGNDTLFQVLSLRVSAIEITTPGVLPNATQNVAYTASVTASPAAAYTFSANGLPNGLSMNSSGGISGTVNSGGGSNLGKFSVNVSVNNINRGTSYNKTMSIDVVGAVPTLPSIAPANSYIFDCTVGVPCNRAILVQSGGIAPFTWTAIGLPTGMSIRDGDGVTSSWITPGDAELWGTPAATGTFSVQLTVTDATGATATNTFPMSVSPLLQPTFLQNGMLGVAYSHALRVIGGAGPYTAVQSGGQLAAGLSLNGTTLVLSGRPTESGTFNPAFTYTDGGSQVLRVDSYLSVNGPDSLSANGAAYLSVDGASSALSIDIAVNAVNVAPTATPDTFNTDEDTPLIVSAPGVLGNDSDSDSPTITAVLLSGPAHGTLVLNQNGGFTYTPAADYSGADSFTYKATDGSLDSNGTTVVIMVRAVNDAPAAVNDNYQTSEDTPLSIAAPGVLANDRDVDLAAIDAGITLSWDPISDSTVKGYVLHYGTTPAKSSQVDVGKTTLWTLRGLTAGQQYYFAVTAYNLQNQEGGPSNEVNTIVPPATPPVSATLSAVLVAVPAHGTLTMNANGSFAYSPAPNYQGPDSFTYKANDGALDSNVATVSITVTAANDAPVAANGTLTTLQNTSVSGTLVATDVDGGALTYVIVTNGTKGTATITNAVTGAFTYTPAANANGTDSFVFKARDASLDSNTATVTISITPVNVTPSITPSATTVASGGTVTATAANGPGTTGDFVALYATGAPAPNYLQYQYLNGTQTAPTVGLSGATLTFTLPQTPGTYQLRFFRNNTFTVLATSSAIAVVAPSITPSATTGVAGATVTATIANGPGTTGDFAALYATGAPSANYLQWQYLNGTQTAPTTGLTGAALTFTLPPTAGTYELRFFRNNTFTLLATSVPITVVASPSIAVSATTVAPGAAVTATVANGPGTTGDFAALYATGATAGNYLQYQYLNGTQAAPAVGLSGATLTFTLPQTPGTYELRFFRNNTFTLLAVSAVITVGAPSITLSATIVTPGATVTATVANGPSTTGDFVALYATGAQAPSYLQYQYLNGTQTAPTAGLSGAALTFILPQMPGTYELRFFRNNTFAVLATSAAITVDGPSITASATAVAPGATVTATVANGPGTAGDFVALYSTGAPAPSYLQYQYLNGTHTAPTVGLSGATLSFSLPQTPGTYELRFFRNDTFAVLATSGPITSQ